MSLCESNAVERDIRAKDRSRKPFVEQDRFFMFSGVNIFLLFKLNLIYDSLLALKLSIWHDLIVLVQFIII